MYMYISILKWHLLSFVSLSLHLLLNIIYSFCLYRNYFSLLFLLSFSIFHFYTYYERDTVCTMDGPSYAFVPYRLNHYYESLD